MNKSALAVETAPSAYADAADIRRVFEAQRETMLRWRHSTADDRLARIQRLVEALEAHEEAIVQAGADDFNKPREEVLLTDFAPVLIEAKDARRHIRKWMKSRSVAPTQLMVGTKAWIQYEPKGRSLIISPWNYPVTLTFGPLISALAAGCTAIIKPSEMTPHLSAVMARIVKETFDESEVALFEGEVETSQTLLDLPFDHIFFTGSPAIGKVVMAAAAKHLASVTLELGGKSPTIVDETADVQQAARTIAWGKYTNNGQTCIAPDHIYVHESVREEFTKAFAGVLAETYGEDGEAQMKSPYLARIVNSRHAGRVKALLDDARERGANVLFGGDANVDESFVAPTLLGNIPDDAEIMSEEIFGPLLPIIGYDNIDEVIDRINAAPKPLALYIWSKDEGRIEKVLRSTSSGGVCINHTVVQFLHSRLPFGGVNNSGIGAAHGEYGFKAFSHERAVVKTRFMLARLFFPPYNDRTRKIIDMVRKTL